MSRFLIPRRPSGRLFIILTAAAGLIIARAVQAQCDIVIPPNTPLNDLAPAYYQGFQGGLYPGGLNQRPPTHEAAGISIADTLVVPRDQFGNPSPLGKIVMISIGMSNATQEFSGDLGSTTESFVYRAQQDPSTNPQLVLIDGAQADLDARLWANPRGQGWGLLARTLTAAGINAPQVQVAWIKEALVNPATYGAFPLHAQKLQGYLEDILRNLKMKYPNCQLAYLSPRTRAYSSITSRRPLPHSPEPFAYETGFGDQWTIADQVNKTGNIGYTGDNPVAPWISWGPYLWADGVTPRSDGLTWQCTDVEATDEKGKPDFVHPSVSGITKVSDQLLAFFKTDPTTMPWFLNAIPTGVPPTAVITTNPTPAVITVGQSVSFTATASAHNVGGSITQYAWTYDDGGYAFGATPTKLFTAPGTYNVHLTATDNVGNTVSQTQPVIVSNVP